MVPNYRKKDFRVLFDLALSLHPVPHSLISHLHCLHCNLKPETGMIEASDQEDRIGREKLFVC